MKNLVYKLRRIALTTFICSTILAASSFVMFADSIDTGLIEENDMFEDIEDEFEEFMIIEDPEIPIDVFEINKDYLIESYLIGYPDGTIKPEKTISNAEAATVFVRAFDIIIEDGNYNYAGIDEKHWAFRSINALARENIILAENEYEPDMPLVKERLESSIKNINKYLGTDYVNIDTLVDGDFLIENGDEITRLEFEHIIKKIIKNNEQ